MTHTRSAFTIALEDTKTLRVYYPGVLMIPLLLMLMAAVATMSGLGILPQYRIFRYWPVTLIATGLEEVYLWAKNKSA